MSALKVPLLLVVAIGTHLTNTPPNPSPPTAEQLSPPGIKRAAPKWIPFLINVLFLSCIMSESLVLLEGRFPALPFVKRILAAFDPVGGSSRLALTPLFLAGVVLNVVGSAVRLHCYAALRTLFTFELGIHKDHHLITTGVYGVVRHPSYSGGVVSVIGVAMCTLTPGTWIIECTTFAAPRGVIAAICVIGLTAAAVGLRTRMQKEDEMLRKRFGREWDEWAARVPCWVIPGVY
ncbi:hypothetical protein C8R47DRAFT_1268772 [Mycena vitilis]|nr:hypothetical protein C8R47DRAFT_1268772 [Mycena vitilis]